MKVIITAKTEVLIKDIVEGYMKGNHTLLEMVELMDTVLNDAKMAVR